MPDKLVIVAHGIGDHPNGFSRDWEDLLRANHPRGGFAVAGLAWEDILQEAADRYPICSQAAVAACKRLGFAAMEPVLGSDAYKRLADYATDVLTYVLMPDVNRFIRYRCALRLEEIRAAHGGPPRENVILIGHSLGAALLPHLAWDHYRGMGSIPWRGMILLASPLGIASPWPRAICDPLQAMIGDCGHDRPGVLREFGAAWRRGGSRRLYFLINRRDMVCWDARFEPLADPLPVRQRFAPEEQAALEEQNPGCLHFFDEGETDLTSLCANHALRLYLNRPEFRTALDDLLAG